MDAETEDIDAVGAEDRVQEISDRQEIARRETENVSPKTENSQPAVLVDSAALKAQTAARKLLKKHHGFFRLPEEKEREDSRLIAASILSDEDDWLKRVVKSKPAGSAHVQKASGWSLFRDRFFGANIKSAAAPALRPLSRKELENDTFLKRVEKKNPASIVGTASTEEEPMTGKATGAFGEFASADESAQRPADANKRTYAEKEASGTLSVGDLRKEAKAAREAAERLTKEVKEIKREMKEEAAEQEPALKAPEPVVQQELPRRPPKAVHPKKSGLEQFFAALGHIGMGKERMHFTENLAMMLKAGLPLIDTLKTLQLETRSRSMKKLLQKLLNSVENGSPLWRAMEEQSFFSLHALALVRIGEEAGNLAENVEYLAAQEEKDRALRGKVKMAMIYPSIVLTMMFVIVIGLGMFVLPNLIGVLYSLNVPLPFITRMVILFSDFFTQHGTVAVPSAVGGFVFFAVLGKFTPLKVVVQWCMFKIPGIGALARQATIARFGVILGGLLKAGVPVIEAMQSLVEVTPIVAYRHLYQHMLDHITVGDSFAKSFASIRGSQKLLPPSVQQLVITGEKSGSLSSIMLKIADIYDKKASETAQKLPVILEPMLLIFIGGLVATIAFAIIIPIYSIVGNVAG